MELWLIIAVAVLIRLCTGLHPYSGHNDPPKYGDFEAQRHWMEITTNTPILEWYVETPHNNLSYWPLDYPPVSGYQSWIHGKVVARFDPKAVALHTSRGYETYYSKLLMRWTVIGSDLLVFFPAIVACALVYTRLQHHSGGSGSTAPNGTGGSTKSAAAACRAAQVLVLVSALMQPASVLIDHGHFQYNCISLGFAAAAVGAIMAGRDVLGSVFFCLSLNHKQMSLFFAPAFFGHLLGKCLQASSVSGKVMGVAKLGVTVIASFVICWSPFLTSKDLALTVLGRILPVKRGLYEDYVANFWCASSVIVKWKSLFAQPLLMRLCAASVLAAATPSMVHQMMRPSPKGLLLCMVNSAMAFFMFSYQVHEKSILLPLLPLTLLAPDHPHLATYLPILASFSMFPLLERDGLTIAYIGCILTYLPAMVFAWIKLDGSLRQGQKGKPAAAGASTGVPGTMSGGAGAAGGIVKLLGEVGRSKLVVWGLGLVMFGLHVAKAVVPPPQRLPWLWDRAFISLSFVVFAGVMVYLNLVQWSLPREVKAARQSKKKQ